MPTESSPRSAAGNAAEIAALLGDERPATREAGARRAGREGSARHLRVLHDLTLHDPSQRVRREAAASIGRIAAELPEAFAMLAALAEHSDPGVVLQAARGLTRGARDCVRRTIADPLLDRLAAHPNEVVRDFVAVERGRTARGHNALAGGGGVNRPKHREAPGWLENRLVHGDARELLRRLPDDSIHLTFTSPPYYNARDYSVYQSYEAYLDFLEAVFGELHRVTKEGRFLVVNTSPVIVPRAGRQHESHRFAIPFDLHPRLTAQGWRFIDDIIWRKPDGAAKPRNSGFAVHRQPLTWKANAVTEYVMVYRKRSTRLIDWNLRQYPAAVRDASRAPDDYEATNVWEIDPAVDRVHSAVFPTALCERVIAYYSMIGDLVFDPFAGSGTVGAAALKLERKALLAEINDRYVRRIQNRVGLAMRPCTIDQLLEARDADES